jgi:hypothetical protein
MPYASIKKIYPPKFLHDVKQAWGRAGSIRKKKAMSLNTAFCIKVNYD